MKSDRTPNLFKWLFKNTESTQFRWSWTHLIYQNMILKIPWINSALQFPQHAQPQPNQKIKLNKSNLISRFFFALRFFKSSLRKKVNREHWPPSRTSHIPINPSHVKLHQCSPWGLWLKRALEPSALCAVCSGLDNTLVLNQLHRRCQQVSLQELKGVCVQAAAQHGGDLGERSERSTLKPAISRPTV